MRTPSAALISLACISGAMILVGLVLTLVEAHQLTQNLISFDTVSETTWLITGACLLGLGVIGGFIALGAAAIVHAVRER